MNLDTRMHATHYKILSLLSALLLVMAASGAYARSLNGFDLDDVLVKRKLIRSGGPPRDGIPSIDSPRFVEAGEADYLADSDRVLGVVIDGVTKAYPVKILNYHEIVNDYFGDVPVTVTFCPLCGTGIAFDAVVDGQARQFGVSGLLYNSDVLMYDRQTESLWSQILAQAISGPARGQKLRLLPVRHTTWADWRKRYPETRVLAEPRGFGRNYDVDPYVGYATSNRLWAPVAHKDRRYPRKSVVVGVIVNGAAHAWPFSELPEDGQVVVDTVGGQTVRLQYDHATRSAAVLDTNGREIPSFTAFWFAWVAFHPDTGVYKGDRG